MSVVRHMFCESFGTQKSMVTFVSKFDLRKGQFQVKLGLGQIQNFKFSYKNMPILSSFVSVF